MRIAAVYIPAGSLPYIFGDKDITINLGGRYFYELGEIHGRTKIISKTKNNKFIEDFWGADIMQLSAVVGANGTGKSSILQTMKNGCQFVMENGDKTEIIWTDSVGRFIYHSPYLAETKSDEESSQAYNISKLSQMRQDSKYENLDFNGHWEYHNSERLIRIISFLENEKLLKELEELHITIFSKTRIKFTDIGKDDWNTSRNFLPFFNDFKKRIDNDRTNYEIKLQNEYKITTDKDLENQSYNLSVNKNRLKLSILKSIVHKLHSVLESTGNKYLEEGFINNDIKVSDESYKRIESAQEAFMWFINNAYFKLSRRKYFLPVNEIYNLLNVLFDCVDNVEQIDNWTILEADFTASQKIIFSYQKFLLAFKEFFSYDETIFMTFYPDKNLSTGEMSFYEFLSSLYDAKYRIDNKIEKDSEFNVLEDKNHFVFLLDESDLGFHPFWKRKYIKILTKILPIIFSDKKISIIITTHDPLTLSDIPNYSVAYLNKTESFTEILDHKDGMRPKRTFGANISDLLADSFFIKDGLIGEFAIAKIDQTILWLNNPEDNSNEQYHKLLIENIDEPIIRRKLSEMYSEKMKDNLAKKLLLEEIKSLYEKYKKM